MPVVNRLGEVKHEAEEEDVESQKSSEEEGQNFMNDFFDQVKIVKEDMRVMGKKLGKIEAAYARALNEVKIDKAQGSSTLHLPLVALFCFSSNF